MSGLSPEQHARRENKVNASFVPYLMAGNTARTTEEWMRLVGHPDYVEPDLSMVWAVIRGIALETPALDYWQRKTGKTVLRRGESVNHPAIDYVACTLDGLYDSTVIDVKVLGGYRKLDDACSFYVPQMVVQRACTGAKNASLLVCHGDSEPTEYPLTWDADYEDEVWHRIAEFWGCVLDLTPPHPMPEIAAPVVAAIEYSMHESNLWGNAASDWLSSRGAHKIYVEAERELKALVPADAKRAYGHGISVTRAKNGNLTVREDRS